MSRLTPYFSSNRAVREYTEKFYLPAAQYYHSRIKNNCALSKQIVNWQHNLEKNWNGLRFGELKIETDKNLNLFEVQVYFNNLNREAVKVELYSTTMAKEMECHRSIPNVANGYVYRAEIPTTNPPANFTPRIVPYFYEVTIPLESTRILWQK